MFPGQSSFRSSILADAALICPDGQSLLTRASEVLGQDLLVAARDGVEPTCNQDVQIAVFVANHLYLAALGHAGCNAQLSLGLSLGEYNHLVHIGALSFEHALKLVAARGAVYDQGPAGVMVAVAGVYGDTVQEVLAATAGFAQISNFNGPTQHVIAGETQAVLAATRTLEDEHYAMCVVIERKIPMHSQRFAEVADQLSPHLQVAPWQPTVCAYFPNARGVLVPNPTATTFVTQLRHHVYKPVQWARSLDLIAQLHPDALMVEVGPGRILSNLARRGWPQLRTLHTSASQAPTTHFSSTVRSLHDAA